MGAMNLGGLDLNLLVALDALLSERSVTRAAQRVGLSQPGMSNALGRLRRLFDDPLLVRQGATLVPTARAQALIGPVHEALELIRGALDAPAGFDPATDGRSFRLSCSDYSVLMLIGPLVRTLAADAPGVVVEVLPRLADAGRALLNGDVDLVIEPPEIMGDADLESLRLWDDRWECCVWEGNTRVGKRMTMDVGTLAGQWRPVLPLFVNDPGAWLKDVKPFLIENSSQFGGRGPYELTSRRYAREFNEVKALGAIDSTTRTLDQTQAGRFWGATNAVATWGSLYRDIAEQHGGSLADNARMFAMLYFAGADAQITVWVDKAKFSFWRPITAIREAAADGNRRTVADPNWLPLVNTPPYPDQPSGLSALSGASVRTLQEFFGTDDVAFGATNAVGITRDYTTFSQAVDEVVNARVWSGIHFRNADEVGAAIGQRIARWQEHRFPQARDDNDDHNHHGHHHDR